MGKHINIILAVRDLAQHLLVKRPGIFEVRLKFVQRPAEASTERLNLPNFIVFNGGIKLLA